MNAKNLPLKFAFVALLVAVCLYSLYAQGLQYGIDLQGGHSLIFEIRKTSQAEIDARKADLAAVEAKLKNAQTDKEKATLQQQVDNLKAEIDKLSETVGSENLAEKMIEILKERIDPQGLANLEWRPVGTDRIEVRMPAARVETRQRQEVYDTAMRKLAESNVSRAQRRNYLYGSADQRKQILSELKDPNQSQALEQLGTAFDTERAAEKALRAAQGTGVAQAVAKAQAAYDTARAEYRTKQLEEADASIRIPHLEGILRNYRSPAEQEGLSDTEKADLKAQFEKDLTDLEQEHPGRKALIEDVVAAYKSWAAVRHRLSDPTDLERRIARAGVLEFRIVAGDQGEPLTRDQRQQYINLLEQEGPGEARRRGMPFAWFPIRGTDRKSYGGMVTAQYAGKWYLLLSNQKGYKMTRDTAEGGWSLDSARRGADDMGQPAIDFTFDEAGARKFYALTSANVGKAMAILLDDEVFSAPRINSAISNRGQITGKFSYEEVEENVKLLQAGSLPARLNPTPVAVRSFGPTLGKENRDAGIRAAYMGMICVAAFMLIYYLLAGMIADVALVLNIILVLGAMSLLSAVFTLPGIAGVILTIGIAVDANVLIFERLREEQAKGQTVRMALKNAYERAFSAIFDANITTLLTCLILGWVGTIEVRGFAITLGLGVLFSLFTALIVTRWIFQILLDAGWLKNSLKMLTLIATPKVNWMSKRVFFWCLSGAFIVLGIVAISVQGSSILGIEFSSGTQATLQFRTDALLGPDKQLPNAELVRQMFTKEVKSDPNYSRLADARVEMLLDNQKADRLLNEYDKNKDGKVDQAELKASGLNKRWIELVDTNRDGILERSELENPDALDLRYQVSSTETNPQLIQEVASKAFGKSLQQMIACKFNPLDTADPNDRALIERLGLVTSSRGLAHIDPNDNSPYRDTLEDYAGGVAVVVKDVNPPISEAEFKQRIADTRAQERGAEDVARQSVVIGLGNPQEGNYSAFAVLVMLEDVSPSRWNAAADQQKTVVYDALQRQENILTTSFDAAIAGSARQRAIVAIVLSWIAIVLYLWLRFGSVQWGLAAVICLIHDTVIVTGLIATTGWIYNSAFGQLIGVNVPFKIDLAMIAAILTVIGYSVNDTIVVFDRIRENRGKLTTVSVPVINKSINQTLSRTLLTSGTTLIVVLIMYIWGGAGIKGFNFALLAGILFGTYSSIAVASPLLLGFKKAVFGKAAEFAAE